MLFFTMLFMYSAFVLTSISTKYYVQDIARVFEYYVYFWGAGDFIEELISCFVSILQITTMFLKSRIYFQSILLNNYFFLIDIEYHENAVSLLDLWLIMLMYLKSCLLLSTVMSCLSIHP